MVIPKPIRQDTTCMLVNVESAGNSQSSLRIFFSTKLDNEAKCSPGDDSSYHSLGTRATEYNIIVRVV